MSRAIEFARALPPDPLPVVWRGREIGTVVPDGRGGVWSSPFQSLPQIDQAWRVAQRYRAYYSKLQPQVAAALWFDMWPVDGMPAAGGYAGTAQKFVQTDDTTVGSLFMGGNTVSGATKNILRTRAKIASTAGPMAPVLYYDRVGHYPSCTIANTLQTMDNTLPALRYTTTGGMRIVVTNQGGTGATASNFTNCNYVNQSGGASAMPTPSQPWAIPTSFAAATTPIPAQVMVPYLTAVSFNLGPFLSLSSPDYGVRSVTSYQMDANNTGSLCFVLAKTLAICCPSAQGMVAEFDAFRAMLDGYRIYDGACVATISNSLGGLSSLGPVEGGVDMVWQ